MVVYTCTEGVKDGTNRRQYGRRCSWCFKEGHNKRTCPAYTVYLKEQAEKHGGYSLSKYVAHWQMPDGSKPTGELAAVKETAKKSPTSLFLVC